MSGLLPITPVRAGLDLDYGLMSFLDFGGPGRPLLALHGHLDQGKTWTDLARELAPEWRVIAPDQRGHGESDRATDYSREAYIADIIALLDVLGLSQVVVLGHSMNTAYKFAARYPDRVSALINVDAPVLGGTGGGPSALSFVLDWPYEASTRDALLEGLGPVGPIFADVLCELPDGTWRLPFHPQDMVTSEELGHGDHWADWLASDCPALLVAGTHSQALPSEQAHAMVERRPNTRLVALNTDHFVHTADPAGFANAVREFLRTLGPSH
ncbi:MAG: putative hydrolase [Actinomycetia bacterium]|nr:putative hydrolase [Actinomycetes bacterium]